MHGCCAACSRERRILQEADISGPYCEETLSLLVEPFEQTQQYTEDCKVCCQPIVIIARY
ncbi:CPXCG motif-containing cysteine-rich protein [Pseudomonadota bacterium]